MYFPRLMSPAAVAPLSRWSADAEETQTTATNTASTRYIATLVLLLTQFVQQNGCPYHSFTPRTLAIVMHICDLEVHMKALSWINFILGLWLILAGFVLSKGSRPEWFTNAYR